MVRFSFLVGFARAAAIAGLLGAVFPLQSFGSHFSLALVPVLQVGQPPPRDRQPDGPRRQPPGMRGGGIPAIPGLEALASPQVQRELELVDEQKQQLREIAQEFIREIQPQMAEIQQLPMEERRERMSELQQKVRKRSEDVRRQVERILLPHQLDALEDFNLRMRREAVLKNPRMLEQLGISEQQRKKLRQAREEMDKRMQELEDEMFERILKVLNSQQTEKLKEMLGGRLPTKKSRK